MAYEEQRSQIRGALQAAGISPDAATDIANILCNSAIDLKHSGTQTTDTTPPELARVTPDVRKHQLKGFDFRDGDPDYRRPGISDTEEAPSVEPPSNLVTVIPHQREQDVGPVVPGKFANVAVEGGAMRVGVKHKQPGAKGGIPIAAMDPKSGTFLGKMLRFMAGDSKGRIKAEIVEGSDEIGIGLQPSGLKTHDVVTRVEYHPSVGLRVHYKKLTAWDEGVSRQSLIRATQQQVVSDIADDLDGPRLHTKKLVVLENIPAGNVGVDGAAGQGFVNGTDIYFNLIRIGTFTGAWAVGDTKTVEQVWPSGGENVTVKNYIRPVAAPSDGVDSTRYVLWCVRTKDEKNVAEVDGENEKPIPTEFPPEIENIAIEIQEGIDDCVQFDFLTGKKVGDLTGYAGSDYQALSHTTTEEGATPCLKWRGEEITVLTGMVVDSSGIQFKQRDVWVLKAADEEDGEFVPFTYLDAVYALEYDATAHTLKGKRKTIRVLGAVDATDTTVGTYEVISTKCPTLGGSGLYFDTVKHRTFEKADGDPCSIPTEECPPPPSP